MSDFDTFPNLDALANKQLQNLLHTRLYAQLNSPIAETQKIYRSDIAAAGLPPIEPVATTTKNELSYLNDIFLNFSLATFPQEAINTIIAFSFGNRLAAGAATPSPGPINEKIADAVFSVYQHHFYKRWPHKAPSIYAQWEVATVLAEKYQLASPVLNSVSPPTVANGTVTIPPLASVVGAIIALAPATSLGNVGIITHRDQAKSGIEAAAEAGLTAAAIDSIALPKDYDSEASLPANRQRYLFLLSDMVNQFALLRANLIAEEYPNG